MTRKEMIDIVRRVSNAEGTEEQLDRLMDELETAAPNARISNLIFWTSPELTPEQVVDEAIRREIEHARGDGSAANEF